MKEEQLDTEDWKELRRQRAERRWQNHAASLKILKANNIHFEERNQGVHLMITHAGKTVDYWPTTGKWIDRAQRGMHKQGLFPLLKHLGVTPL